MTQNTAGLTMRVRVPDRRAAPQCTRPLPRPHAADCADPLPGPSRRSVRRKRRSAAELAVHRTKLGLDCITFAAVDAEDLEQHVQVRGHPELCGLQQHGARL